MKKMILDILKSDWANLFYIFSLVLSAITLLVLIQYASDTKMLAVQSQLSNFANLRPLIERSGVVDWNNNTFDIDSKNFQRLNLVILKNVATNISGYIVINGFKYTLLFASDISQIATDTYAYYETWGWMKPDTTAKFWAGYKSNSKQAINAPNQINISYADIEGNRYCTLDDVTLSNPRSFSCSK